MTDKSQFALIFLLYLIVAIVIIKGSHKKNKDYTNHNSQIAILQEEVNLYKERLNLLDQQVLEIENRITINQLKNKEMLNEVLNYTNSDIDDYFNSRGF